MEAEFILVSIDSFYMKMIWNEFAACFWSEPYLIKRAAWGHMSAVPHIFSSQKNYMRSSFPSKSIFPDEMVREETMV